MICAAKFASNSKVQIAATPFVDNKSKITGSLRITTKPNLLGGPGGKGVAGGAGVSVGRGVAVGFFGFFVGVGSMVGSMVASSVGIKSPSAADDCANAV